MNSFEEFFNEEDNNISIEERNRLIEIDSSNTVEEPYLDIGKIRRILEKLKRSRDLNNTLQIKCRDKIYQKQMQIIKIDQHLEKIKKLKEKQQKKHPKFTYFAPLEHLYGFASKRTNIYYYILETISENLKKLPPVKGISEKPTPLNKFGFSKKNDDMMNNVLFLYDDVKKNSSYNWLYVAELLNKLEKKTQNLENPENSNKPAVELTMQEDKFTALNCYVRYLENSSFYKYKKWTTAEDKILKKALLFYGPKNWQQISYCLEGRSNCQCFHRWMKSINPKIKREKWNISEDLVLGIALNKIYGELKWTIFSNHLPGRTDIQCRERWCNILDPSLEGIKWSEEEDKKLLTLYQQLGNKWSLIAREYGNRTDNSCWRRWKFLLGVDEENKNKKRKSATDIFAIVKK